MKGILRSGDSTARIKKSLRFNEVILSQECQLYPAEIDVILARKYKNFKKAEQKRRKANQRLKSQKKAEEKKGEAADRDKPDSDSQTSCSSADESKDCYQVRNNFHQPIEN